MTETCMMPADRLGMVSPSDWSAIQDAIQKVFAAVERDEYEGVVFTKEFRDKIAQLAFYRGHTTDMVTLSKLYTEVRDILEAGVGIEPT